MKQTNGMEWKDRKKWIDPGTWNGMEWNGWNGMEWKQSTLWVGPNRLNATAAHAATIHIKTLLPEATNSSKL